MTTLTDGGNATMAELASRLDPSGQMAKITDLLSKKNRILDFLPWMEGNLTTGHEIAQTTTALPTADWRQPNLGVTASKGQTVTYVETCGRLESETLIDTALLELNGGTAWLKSENDMKKEGIGQQFGTAFFYESVSSNPERVHGLTPRYPGSSGYTASSYVIVGTNAGVNAKSMWLLTPQDRKLYGIYPKGTKAGLETIDNGRVRIQDSSTTAYWANSVTNIWRCGIAVEDYRYCVRGQWDPDDAAMAAEDRGLILMLEDMIHTIYEQTERTVLVMNRDSIKLLNKQLRSNENRQLDYLERTGGKMVGDPSSTGGLRMPHYNGIPIVLSDLLVSETAIS